MATVARRAQSSNSGRASSKPTTKTSSGFRGSAGLQKMQEEQEAAAARKEANQMNANMPFRFFCEPGGNSKEIVIVDHNMSEVFWRYEHNLKDRRSGKWTIFTACLDRNANCPVCKVAERDSYYAMYLTVIDLTPYVTKDGVEVDWSKKLLVVKSAQQKKITRLADRHKGNLRGMILEMTRDGDKDASIGNDIEFVEFMPEEELQEYETDYTYKDSNGKRMTKHIVGHEPFDYDELFPMPTEQQLRAIVGGKPEPGSREDDDEHSGRSSSRSSRNSRSGDGWDDEDPPPRRGASTRRTARNEIDEEDRPDVGADEDEDPPPRSSRSSKASTSGRTAPAPAQRTATRRAAKVAEPEEEEEEEEEAAPPPRRSRAAAPAPARTTTRRAAKADPEEEEEEEEEAPPRVRESLAERRRALRR